MGKLESFAGMCTNTVGLWWHPETCCFSSETINLADLRKFKGVVRFYVRKNKFFNKGENNRPNYVLWMRDANGEKAAMMEAVIEDEAVYRTKDGERLYTREEVNRVKVGACEDGQDGYCPGDLLIEDYI